MQENIITYLDSNEDLKKALGDNYAKIYNDVKEKYTELFGENKNLRESKEKIEKELNDYKKKLDENTNKSNSDQNTINDYLNQLKGMQEQINKIENDKKILEQKNAKESFKNKLSKEFDNYDGKDFIIDSLIGKVVFDSEGKLVGNDGKDIEKLITEAKDSAKNLIKTTQKKGDGQNSNNTNVKNAYTEEDIAMLNKYGIKVNLNK